MYFIIGHANKNWRKNEEFASSIHERMEKTYPGISRGIWGKTSSQGNGEYNQSLSPGSILIEIGGIDNTEEELGRTAKVLAGILADIYWEGQDAQKAGSLTKNNETDTDVNQKSGSKANVEAGSDNKKS
ncbi:Stage II sporulation protein P (SpoIIP) [compost metagenome]